MVARGRHTQVRAVLGWAGSGLTERCIQIYRQWVSQGEDPDRIVFLVRTQPQAQRVQRRILQQELAWIGPLRVETYLGFVLRQMREQWSQVRRQLPQLPEQFEPLVLGKDLSQFLLSQLCQSCPSHGEIFKTSSLKPYQIWDQLSSAAYIGGSSGLDPEMIGTRLTQAWPDPHQQERLAQLQAVGCCLGRLQDRAVALGALEYGLLYRLFQQTILPLEGFWQGLDHLIVDQAEESPGVLLSLFEQGIGRLQSLDLAYTWGGGVSFTGVPDPVYDFIQTHANPERLTQIYKGSSALVCMGDRIAAQVDSQWHCPLPLPPDTPWPLPQYLEGETQMEAVEQMVLEIESLQTQGVALEQIAIIAPRLDPGLTLTVTERLGSQVLPLRPFPSLVKYPLVRAVLTLVDLGHPQWERFPTWSELQVMLSLVLNLDPVRAGLLAEDVLDPRGRRLRSMAAVRFPERVGFAAVRHYQTLVEWLSLYHRQQDPAPLDDFLSQLYREVLAPCLSGSEDQELLQTVIETARTFRQTLPHYSAWECLQMIRSGQIPHRSAWEPQYQEFLVIAPPVAYINQGLSADYQFWFDISSPLWSRSLWRPLYNPEVLTPTWPGQVFGEDHDLRCRSRRLARILFNLCCRTRRRISLVRSGFNFRGEENTEIWDELIVTACLSEWVA